MKNIEILAPAGGMQQIIAACRSGADAVYFGSKNFNARRNADNFDDLKSVISYCHARNVRCYITFNTLLFDDEIVKAVKEAEDIVRSGADAVILQDLAAADIFKKICPDIPLFASTQMSVHNISGVRILEDSGFSRIVLARELSKREIQRISESTSVELEAFVHGAHCMSLSGQCYLSSLLGQRSGNRGLCAQPCRLNWKCRDREYALSLKDLSLITRIAELADIGITSLKIEGRMKRPEYVSAAVRECVKARNGEKPDMELLEHVFSRSGFTDGYFSGRLNSTMFGIRTEEDVRNTSGILGSIAETYKHEAGRVPVIMKFSAQAGRPAVLDVTDGINSSHVSGPVPEKAVNIPATEQMIIQNLQKCGGTVFIPKIAECIVEDGIFLSRAAINSMRQRALAELMDKRESIPDKTVRNYEADAFEDVLPGEKPMRRILLSSFEQFSEELAENASLIGLYPDEIIGNLKKLSPYIKKIAVRIPGFISPLDEPDVSLSLSSLYKAGIRHAFVSNISGIYLAHEHDLIPHGTSALNITNSIAMNEIRKYGVADQEYSIEVSLKDIAKMRRPIRTGLLVYGYLPLMITRSCPAAGTKGCINCSSSPVLKDRTKREFTVFCHGHRYQEILNSCPLWMADKSGDIKGIDYADFLFTSENRNECLRVLKIYDNNEKAGSDFTRGLYYKDVL